MKTLMSRFPRKHALLACALAVPLASLLLAEPDRAESPKTVTGISASVIPLPDLSAVGRDEPEATEPVDDPVTAPVSNAIEHREVVRSGDNLALIFKRLALEPADLHAILDSGPEGDRLKRIYPGQELRFVTTLEQGLVSVKYVPSALETLEFQRGPSGFTAHETLRQPDLVTSYRHGVIDQSLFVATQRLGFNDDVALRLAQIFQWDIDFVLDIRKGDEFFLVYEEQYVDDKFIGFGKILAAEFVNQGQSYRAILYTDQNGDANYYTPDGQSMRKAFLRAPVEFTRISSNFSLRRFHPIHKRMMAHRGIDYAAPSGTPVLAAGAGRVAIATRTGPSGNYVVLQHGEQFQTKYLHLSKFARGIRAGQKVGQGQVIGYVGATGWATAPHLHYEFLVNGVHKNPRTVSLPQAEPIRPAERQRFNAKSKPLLALLDNYKDQQQKVELADAQ
jgi:murein DD-endopeptidase MepM/ murein hydrolase activator NlpD